MNKLDKKGFSAIEVMLSLLVVGAISVIGWYVYGKISKNTNQITGSTVAGQEIAASRKEDGVNWSESPQGPYHDKVSYATSSDLLNWTDSGEIIAEHASVPDVILKDGTLYVYFVDTSTDGLPEQIALIKSNDNGKTWSKRERVSIKGDGIAGLVPVDPDPLLLSDGRIRLYYFDIAASRGPGSEDNKKHSIYSAISSDGINFSQEGGVRFEEENIFDPDVLKVDDTWRLYVGNPEGQKVISAISSDGLNFTREGVAYEGSSVPNAIYENGKYYLYTAGIQIATSGDGKKYTKTSSMFSTGSGITADPGVVKLGTNNYIMVYKTSDQTAQGPPPVQNP